MQEWFLNCEINPDDVEFINECGIPYVIENEKQNDSGWCDAATGHRIVTSDLRISFNVSTKRDVHILKLKFGDLVYPKTIITESLPE